jgi:hypothetical protein
VYLYMYLYIYVYIYIFMYTSYIFFLIYIYIFNVYTGYLHSYTCLLLTPHTGAKIEHYSRFHSFHEREAR